jgi:peroxiredoxin
MTVAERRIAIGDRAPGFTLPTAQGGHADLASLRGRSVVLWFTKGFGCPFCRQQIAQLARGAVHFRQHAAELLLITRTPVGVARQYAARFPLPFPYLCDVEGQARAAYGLGQRPNPPSYYAKKFVRMLRTRLPTTDFGPSGRLANPVGMAPSAGELVRAMDDEDTGLFIVDAGGVVRFAETAAFRDQGGLGTLWQVPTAEAIGRVLDAIDANKGE